MFKFGHLNEIVERQVAVNTREGERVTMVTISTKVRTTSATTTIGTEIDSETTIVRMTDPRVVINVTVMILVTMEIRHVILGVVMRREKTSAVATRCSGG